jgi:hypothetical protein
VWLKDENKKCVHHDSKLWDECSWVQRYEIMLIFHRAKILGDLQGEPLLPPEKEEEEGKGKEMVVTGTLKKRGGLNTAWQERFFVLDLPTDDLAYYTNEKAFRSGLPPLGTIPLVSRTEGGGGAGRMLGGDASGWAGVL